MTAGETLTCRAISSGCDGPSDSESSQWCRSLHVQLEHGVQSLILNNIIRGLKKSMNCKQQIAKLQQKNEILFVHFRCSRSDPLKGKGTFSLPKNSYLPHTNTVEPSHNGHVSWLTSICLKDRLSSPKSTAFLTCVLYSDVCFWLLCPLLGVYFVG